MSEWIEAIRGRLEAATDGPWRHKRHRSGAAVGVKTSHAFVSNDKTNRSYSDQPGVVFRFEQKHRDPEYDPLDPADANLIAHAPSDIAYLLDRVEALEEVAEAAREAVSCLQDRDASMQERVDVAAAVADAIAKTEECQ